jgi:hypothetical protein
MTVDQALASGSPRLGVFFRLGITPPARLWLGVGNCEAGIDAEDGDGAVYNGLGEMLGVPAFQQLINGTAERVEFRLSGVSARIAQLASSESADVKGVPLLVGLGVFGADWQLLADPTWLKRLTVDYLSIEQEGGGGGVVRSVSLSARSFLTGRRRPGLSYFTDAEQQGRSPGDRFCERTGLYSAEVTKTWPRF